MCITQSAECKCKLLICIYRQKVFHKRLRTQPFFRKRTTLQLLQSLCVYERDVGCFSTFVKNIQHPVRRYKGHRVESFHFRIEDLPTASSSTKSCLSNAPRFASDSNSDLDRFLEEIFVVWFWGIGPLLGLPPDSVDEIPLILLPYAQTQIDSILEHKFSWGITWQIHEASQMHQAKCEKVQSHRKKYRYSFTTELHK